MEWLVEMKTAPGTRLGRWGTEIWGEASIPGGEPELGVDWQGEEGAVHAKPEMEMQELSLQRGFFGWALPSLHVPAMSPDCRDMG